MSNIKLVLTDLDGTVAEFGKHEVSDAVRNAVIACEDLGVQVVPVTGRPHNFALPVLEILGFDGLGIFDNGATIQHCRTAEVLWQKWFAPELARQVASIIAPHSLVMSYAPDHEEHMTSLDELERIQLLEMPTPYVYGLLSKANVDDVLSELSKVQGIHFYTAPSMRPEFPYDIGIQVNVDGASKYHAVEVLREMLDVDKRHALAIGDGTNDLPLFENAGQRIAMGNATEELKQQADHVVASVQDDGFAEAMRHFVLS